MTANVRRPMSENTLNAALRRLGYSKEEVTAHGFRVDDFRRTNMLPLTLEHPLAWRLSGPIWSLNRALARVPGVALLATNLELDTTAL